MIARGISDYPTDRGRYLIEASAGTGKTYTITHLVRELVLAGMPVRAILVTTFSNAAADELKSRILKLLNEELNELLSEERERNEAEKARRANQEQSDAAELQPDLFDRNVPAAETRREHAEQEKNEEETAALRRKRILLQLAVSSIDEMTVSTIHGFCQKMLGEFAIKTGKRLATELAPDESPYIDRLVRAFCRERFYHGGMQTSGVFSKIGKAAEFASEPVDEVVPGDKIADKKRQPEQALCCDAYRYVRDRLQSEKDRNGVMSFNDMIRNLDEALQADNGLAELIRERYQAVFVDEFQDTDQVQYRIFDKCFPKGSSNLFYMIGDPKQAIYRFRGADIYTYLQAKRTADGQFTLTRNFRSSPGMIRAVNLMFGDGDLREGCETSGVFLQKDIPFISIRPGKDDGDFPDNPGAPLRLRHYIGNQDVCERRIQDDILNEIEYLLSEDCPLRIPADKEESGKNAPAGDAPRRPPSPTRSRPPRASDIAVLVQTNAQAAEFVRQLNGRGIAASACKSGKVYGTKEAKLLLLLLRCFLHPDMPAVRGLMLSPFFRADCDAVATDSARAEQFMRQMAECGRTWSQSGLPAAFLQFMDAAPGSDISPRMRILSEFNGERAVTNLVQLMELLYRKESEEHLMPEDVFAALELAVKGKADEENAGGSEENPDQLRLDRDSASVQVMTMFTAKGLEFPVVFVPYPAKKDWQHMPKNTGDRSEIAFRFNKAAQNAGTPGVVLDFGLSDENQTTVRQEEIRNALRLLYVALTRASLVTYLYTRQPAPPAPGKKVSGAATNFTCSAQGVLMMSHKRTNPETAEETAEETQKTPASTIVERKWNEGYFYGTGDLLPQPLADWWARVDAPEDADPAFHVRQFDVFERHFGKRVRTGPLRAEDMPEKMEAAVFAGEVRDDWSIMSFSAFHNILNDRTDEERETPADLDEQNDALDDEAGTETDGETPDAFSDKNLFREFRRGAAVGSMTHKLLELCAGHFDLFTPEKQADPANVESAMNRIASVLRDSGYDAEDETMREQLLDCIRRTFQTALPGLPDGNGGISLSELRQDRMVPEMEFFLDAPASLDIRDIQSILAKSASAQARPLVNQTDAAFDKKGVLNGIIDLIFEHGGKYCIVDWKTNWLGDSDADYTPERVRAAMGRAGYILQSCLYAAALLQLLRQRGLDYDAFGGVYYLFLRGLKRGTRNGIWFDVPPRECLENLLTLFQKGHGK
jgi:exodeoxyribonuclease V beta subunit